MLQLNMNSPLAETLRPQNLADVIGQQHLLGKEGVLSNLIAAGHLPSLILWGPPGVGKTTIARLLAAALNYNFIEISAIGFSVKELNEIAKARIAKPKSAGALDLFTNVAHIETQVEQQGLVVFIDEIHRLNKSQQAQFLPYVERGDFVLIGATTENPSFEVISPLLSRAQVLVLNALILEDLQQILNKALQFLEWEHMLSQDAQEYLIQVCNGDARQLLNFVEAVQRYFHKATKPLAVEAVKQVIGKLHLVYDKNGEEHYNLISALHKSMRGSDANAAVYYLGRMLEAGEDPLYIARRCVRFAAEDIGNADPQALVLANAAFDATNKIGMPEANVILTQLVIYLAQAPKSNVAYKAYKKVQADISQFGNLPVPLKLHNAPTKLMNDLGYGADYKYAHDHTSEELKDEDYLPTELKDRKYVE
jgi:putative ATPase